MRALALILALACAAPAGTVVRRLEEARPCRAGRVVRLTHRYGSIIARPARPDTLFASAVVRVEGDNRFEAAAFASGVELSLAAWADTLFVAVLYPGQPTPSEGFSYEVDVALAVPEGVRLEVANAFGDVEVRGLSGGSSVSNRYGDARFLDCRDISVSVSHGDVHVSGSSGRLDIDCSYGNVYLDEVADRVAVDSRYGNVTGAKLDGEVAISNVLGRIAAEGGRGRWCLVSRYGEVAAQLDDSAMAELDVTAELARVRLLLPRPLPFRIDGRTSAGEIGSSYPLQTSAEGELRRVSGARGQGGPAILFTGAWSDFYIGPGEDSTETER